MQKRKLVYNNHQAVPIVRVIHIYIHFMSNMKYTKMEKSITNMIMILDQKKKAETDFNRKLVLKNITYIFEIIKQNKIYEVISPSKEK